MKNLSLDSAILYSNLSLAISLDSLHQANINKYLGFLHGKKSNIKLSNYYFNNAVKLYSSLRFEPGLYVTKFNLANTNFIAKEYNLAKSNLSSTLEFWKRKNKQAIC